MSGKYSKDEQFFEIRVKGSTRALRVASIRELSWVLE
jgi:hypothetical protein